MLFLPFKFGGVEGKQYLCSRFPGCSAVGSVPGLGPGGRPFESGRPDRDSESQRKVADYQFYDWFSATSFITLFYRLAVYSNHRKIVCKTYITSLSIH